MVGKGLEINVLAQFFFLSALTLIPLSLPLAILLAALMTFGNFGERYELLSMKAAGIPLFRIIRPVVLFCMFLGVMSFFFQNVIGPKAQKELWTLLVSMKQKSPEVDIPEGVFYSDIEGYNIYVKKKDRDTGILKDILIYNFSDGFENAHIIWAEEGKLELTADKKHLYLHLYNGEQFENLKSQSVISRNVPYRRETFKEKHTLIAFDTNFEMVDGNFLNQRSDIKNMNEISLAIDSLNMYADSVGRAMYSDAMKTTYRKPVLSKTDSTKMEKEHLAEVVCESLHLDCPTPDLKDWTEMVDYLKNPNTEVTVALVGKYIQLHDAYISVVEALKHGGIFSRATVNIKWIDSETVTADNVDELLGDVSGILVPGGFGTRGIDGKLEAIKYARTHNVPFLGLCLGMQLSIVEFARDVLGYNDAHSAELDPNTTHPVIHIMPEQIGIEDIGGTLRLGAYPCVLDKTSKAYEMYGTEQISERHRHRYEVNNDYRDALTSHGMKLSGLSPDGRIVEMIEIPEHPWFVATQAHPELKSRPNRPHPLFRGFIEAALKYQNDHK